MSQSGGAPTDRNQSALNWVAVAVALLLAVVYLQLGRVSGQTTYFVVAAALFGWLVLFFTAYWQPIFYVVAATATATIAAFWIVWGTWVEPLRQVAIVLNVVFLAISSYLLISEESVL